MTTDNETTAEREAYKALQTLIDKGLSQEEITDITLAIGRGVMEQTARRASEESSYDGYGLRDDDRRVEHTTQSPPQQTAEEVSAEISALTADHMLAFANKQHGRGGITPEEIEAKLAAARDKYDALRAPSVASQKQATDSVADSILAHARGLAKKGSLGV